MTSRTPGVTDGVKYGVLVLLDAGGAYADACEASSEEAIFASEAFVLSKPSG